MTGEVLHKSNELKDNAGKGRIFNPNPVVTLNDTDLKDNSQIPDSAYLEVDLENQKVLICLTVRLSVPCTAPAELKDPITNLFSIEMTVLSRRLWSIIISIESNTTSKSLVLIMSLIIKLPSI